MWGRSVYSLQANFVFHYNQGRTQYNFTPASAAQFAIREVENSEGARKALDSIRSAPAFAAAVGVEDCPEAVNQEDMKGSNVLDCAPLPSRGSRKSVNWAPQFLPPEKEKNPAIKRSSSRLSSLGSASSKPENDSTLLGKMSNTETHATQHLTDENLPAQVVSYPSNRRGKKQQGPRLRQPKNPSRVKSNSRLLRVPKNNPTVTSDLRLRKRPRPSVGEDIGKKGPKDEHHGNKQRSKRWVSVPLDDMETKVETNGRNQRRASPEANQTCAQIPSVEMVDSEDGCNVAINNVSEVLQESTKLLKEKGKGETDDNTLPELLKAITGVKGFICEVEHMVQTLREEMVERIRAEKAQCEANAAAERQKLRDEITKLKQINRSVSAEKSRVQREINKLQKDYVGTLESAKNSLKLQLDRENAELANVLSKELAKEQDKSYCQICFSAPRDAIVLPCMHFQYCNECLQKHQLRNKECPTCRGKINGVLRCNLSTS